MNKLSIASITILYEPNEKVKENIFSYFDHVDYCIIIDNTESFSNSEFKLFAEKNDKYIYVKENKNVGIGKALNEGCKIAIEKGADLVLTMDQDSFFENSEISNFFNLAKRMDWETVGILSPFHLHAKPLKRNKKELDSKLFVMTSGNLLNINVYKIVGLFREDFFIDHIDHEYGLRLNINKYLVIQANNINLSHELGQMKYVNLFYFYKFKYISHTPLRVFYMIRNGLSIIKLYGKQVRSLNYLIAKIIIKEILKTFFEKNKKERIIKIKKALFSK